MDIQLWVIYSHWPIFFAVFMKCLISTALYSNSKNTALHFDFIACLRHHNACSLLFLMRRILICMHQRYLRSAPANIHIYIRLKEIGQHLFQIKPHFCIYDIVLPLYPLCLFSNPTIYPRFFYLFPACFCFTISLFSVFTSHFYSVWRSFINLPSRKELRTFASSTSKTGDTFFLISFIP